MMEDLWDHAWQFHFKKAGSFDLKNCTLVVYSLLVYMFTDEIWLLYCPQSAPGYWRNLDPYCEGTGPPMRRYFHPDGSQTADPGDKVWGGHECCYTVVTSFLADGKIREHYVRINRWPRMFISRKDDWGWKMSNHLFSYSSVPDAGGTGPYFLAY